MSDLNVWSLDTASILIINVTVSRSRGVDMVKDSMISGFYKLEMAERVKKLAEVTGLSEEELKPLQILEQLTCPSLTI